MSNIYIAGAHSRGITAGHYLTYLDPSVKIIAYLYNNDEDNPSDIDGVPVMKIDDNSKLDTTCTVYLGMRGINHKGITETLLKCGMQHIIPVDVWLDIELRNKYIEMYFKSVGRKFEKISDYQSGKTSFNSDATIYVANSVIDKALKENYAFLPEEKIIQVGTSLADRKINADFFDCEGDNISDRNKQFCELTALYWIWKHATEDIVGLVHYRRHFILPEKWVEIMDANNIDVILPVPLYVHPCLEGDYRSRHIEKHWDDMLTFFKVNHKEEYDVVNNYFKTTALFTPCNMLIARREVFNDLCKWMFPVLFYVADTGGVEEDNYQNRYPGFISERLISYFFEKNRDKYKVVYCDKNFLNT
ncbi:hypothetical protein BXO88_15000 [Oribacterium sp. C9]|uniref:DUF4422 domain-containing protein n=1 Tax=Oribacterium sp. C9 TaxID=1943579 RepID=UPI00098FA86B|nr:DUF4422 domain-containing protein [Oribacterium sp. C9]OON84926.1 hypothetical protein BXO88_15000 [Oribacterium sp. C9]